MTEGQIAKLRDDDIGLARVGRTEGCERVPDVGETDRVKISFDILKE